jgi:hypothetical protein
VTAAGSAADLLRASLLAQGFAVDEERVEAVAAVLRRQLDGRGGYDGTLDTEAFPAMLFAPGRPA